MLEFTFRTGHADMNSTMRSGLSVNLGLDEPKQAKGLRLSLPGPWKLAGVVFALILSAIASLLLARPALRRAFPPSAHRSSTWDDLVVSSRDHLCTVCSSGLVAACVTVLAGLSGRVHH